MPNVKGNLFTISAPSGAGKTSLVSALLEQLDNLRVSVSHTTRAQRADEVDAVNYHFVSEQQFNDMRDSGYFIEHARVFDYYYGTSWQSVEQMLKQGNDVILEIDYQGAKQIKDKLLKTCGIFIFPPSLESLKQRLLSRAQDSDEIINKRFSQAKQELIHYNNADYIVVNDVFETALEQLCTIIRSQRLTADIQKQVNHQLIQSLIN